MTNDPTRRTRLLAALTRLQVSCRPTASTDQERALQLAAYIDGLSRYTPDAVERACREWPDQSGGEWWPSLAELGRLASRHDAPASLPRPDIGDDLASQRTRPRDTRTLRDSASLRAEYRELMADLRAHPERYHGAAGLIALGEAIMERAGMLDASARAA